MPLDQQLLISQIPGLRRYARVLTGEEQMDGLTQGAVGFHATSVHPDWGAQFIPTVEIGGHIFYRRAGHGSHLRGMQA